MRVAIKLLLVALAVADAAAETSPIQFSAAVQDFTGEGIVYQRLIFKDGKRAIHYQPPAHWECSLANNRLRLVPSGSPFAEAELSSQPLEAPAASDESALQMLAQQSLLAAPPGSQQAAIVSQSLSPLLLDNNPSLEVVMSFQAMGDTFKRAVLVVNTDAHRIVFRLTAKKGDFDALYRAFRASVLTWEWQPEPAPNE